MIAAGDTLDFVADREYTCRNDSESVALTVAVMALPSAPA
jgi:hypothetical protein